MSNTKLMEYLVKNIRNTAKGLLPEDFGFYKMIFNDNCVIYTGPELNANPTGITFYISTVGIEPTAEDKKLILHTVRHFPTYLFDYAMSAIGNGNGMNAALVSQWKEHIGSFIREYTGEYSIDIKMPVQHISKKGVVDVVVGMSLKTNKGMHPVLLVKTDFDDFTEFAERFGNPANIIDTRVVGVTRFHSKNPGMETLFNMPSPYSEVL